MSATLRTTHRLDTGLRVDPKIVLRGQILGLSSIELEQAIESELCENPALERAENEFDSVTSDMILKQLAPGELRLKEDDREMRRSSCPDDTTPDWIDFATSTSSLADQVLAQLVLLLPTDMHLLAEYLTGCLTETGYLYEPVEEIALACNCSVEDVEKATAALKTCDPAGVGASGLQDSLWLQLDRESGIEAELSQRIVRESLDLFAKGNKKALGRTYNVSPELIERAFALIRSCTPFPGDSYRKGSESQQHVPSVCSDLILSRTEMGWEIDVPGPASEDFSVNRLYQKQLQQSRTSRTSSPDEARHLEHYVRKANDFIGALEQRRQTMFTIGQHLVSKQLAFVTTGDYQFLQPLTKSHLATLVGVHESTISRATQGKFVQIATGELVNFEVFFKPALRIQKMIEQILSLENPWNPLSDDRISALLAERGVVVARRTVNKYRDKTKLLSSRRRRTA